MTDVHRILDEFFSPISRPRLWVMRESDRYTKKVRNWDAVIWALRTIKSDLRTNCTQWERFYKTNPSWHPVKSDAKKVGAHRHFVKSPAGTEPDICQEAFEKYAASRAAQVAYPLLPIPNWQTENLYLAPIGSFNIYTTLDSIDCAAETATMNFWMYNSMSRRSFGRYADHPAFKASGMKTQYMWWHWVESVDWSTGKFQDVPHPKSEIRW